MTEPESDGRNLRRHRNRVAVLEAIIELLEAGEADPSIADVADRAGVSPRSVYRYFADRDELIQAAMTHIIENASPALFVAAPSEGPFHDRAERFVERRLALYHEFGLVTRIAMRLAHKDPLVAEQVEVGRFMLRQQFLDQFSAELAGLLPLEQTRTVVGATMPFQFEAFEYLRDACNGDLTEMQEILVAHLSMHLGAQPRDVSVTAADGVLSPPLS